MFKPNGLLLYSLWVVISSFALTGLSSHSKNYCQIHDTEINYEYDLREIMNTNDTDIIVIPEDSIYNDTIRMQLCSSLKKKCNNEDGYAICVQYENGIEKGIGKFPPKVSAKQGQITFTFPGIFCNVDPHNKTRYINYTIKIYMQCDYRTTFSRPVLEIFNRHVCRIYMLWKTVLACRPRTLIDCTTAYNNEHFDLTMLTKYSDNYKIRIINDEPSSLLVLNICHSVIHKPGAACPSDSGACMYDKERKRYVNLGNIRTPLIVENGNILLEYDNGDLCDISNNASDTIRRYKTSIMFSCSEGNSITSWKKRHNIVEEKMENHIPEFAVEIAECHFQIVWRTDVACSVEVLHSHETYKTSNCTVQHPVTKSIYNLQPLMYNDYTIIHGGKIHKFSICGPLKNKRCKAGTGLCNVRSGTSYGKANAELFWDELDGAPYLIYQDGDICPSRRWPSYTTVMFFCGRNMSYPPVIMEKKGCDMFIYWRTDLACSKEISCKVNYHANDFSSLMRRTGNYVMRYGNVIFRINVCSSLVPVPGVTCRYGIAACAIELGPRNRYVRSTNLGYPLRNPILNEKQQIVLMYVGGTHCKEDPHKRLSTNITFLCGNRQQKYPLFKSYTNCTYLFEWNTTLACISTTGFWKLPCIVQNSRRDFEYDLSILYNNHQMHYVYGEQGKQYIINICKSKNYCNGSAVCDGSNSYGTSPIILCDHEEEGIMLTYLNGNECGNGTLYTSKLRLVCNEYAGIGTPMLRKESECSVEFKWETEMACVKLANWETVIKASQDIQPPSTDKRFYNNFILIAIIAAFVLGIIVLITSDHRNRTWFCDLLYNLVHRMLYRAPYIKYLISGKYARTITYRSDHGNEIDQVFYDGLLQ